MNKIVRNPLRHALGKACTGAGLLAALLAVPAYADELADVTKLLRAGKAAEALTRTNAFLAKNPADPQMRFMKGVLLTEQNKSDEAIAIFTRLTEDYKDLPEPYNNLAVLYAAGGQYDKARVALEKAIRTNPSYMTAYENLGDVYGKLASQAYDKALALGTTAPPAASKLTLLRTFSSSTGSRQASRCGCPRDCRRRPSCKKRDLASACCRRTRCQTAGGCCRRSQPRLGQSRCAGSGRRCPGRASRKAGRRQLRA